MSGATLNYNFESPTSIAPGTLMTIYGQNLCDNSGAADMSQAYLPDTLLGCEIFVDGVRASLLYVSALQVNAQMPVEYSDRSSVSLYSRVTHADGSITVSAPIGVTVPSGNPGIFAQSGNDPRPGLVYHASSSANRCAYCRRFHHRRGYRHDHDRHSPGRNHQQFVCLHRAGNRHRGFHRGVACGCYQRRARSECTSRAPQTNSKL